MSTGKKDHILKYTVGCDPELFLRRRTASEEFVSAHDVIPGTKGAPFPVNKGAIQVDGTSAEFNIAPAHSADEFVGNIRTVIEQLQEHINKKNNDLFLYVQPTVYFDPAYFKALPASAKAFGCAPDYNAHSETLTKFKGTRKPMRTGAGHIHVGWGEKLGTQDESHLFDCFEAVKQLDAILYFGSLAWDLDTERRSLYGRMGSFRPKPYGVEYRPLSNAYIADPDLQRWIFNTTVQVMALLDQMDVRLYEDSWTKSLFKRVRDGIVLSRGDVLFYLNHMTTEYNLPSLPAAYMKA